MNAYWFVSFWVMLLAWIAGIVVSDGFLDTIGALFIPPYAWYLFIERLMEMYGII